jgi:hypothetical protein
MYNYHWLNAKEIYDALKKYEKLITTSYCIFIPNAALFIEKFLYKHRIYPGVYSKERILLIDTICDTGETFKEWKSNVNFDGEIVTMSIIRKHGDCNIALFEVPKSLQDKWFFGFGMDLINIDGLDVMRDWPAIGWCDKIVNIDDPMIELHPIYSAIKAIGKDELLDICKDGDVYDFRLLATRTRDTVF